MEYRVSFEQQGPTLVARVSGERPSMEVDAGRVAARAWYAIAQEALRRGTLRVLVVADVEGQASSQNALRQAALLEDFGFTRAHRIACVFLRPEMYRVNRLGALVAAEQGWTIEAFDSEAPARRWLDSAAQPGGDA